LILAIAKVLNCTIEDLVGPSQGQGEARPSVPTKHPSTYQQNPKDWNQELYLKCFDIVHSILIQEKITLDKLKILDVVEEIYNYSLGNGSSEPDKYFSQWLVQKKK
jgi:hypothetical protein